MKLPIKLYLSPQDVEGIPEKLTYKGLDIAVHGFNNGCLELAMNDDLSIRDHVRAVEDHFGEDVIVSRDVPVIPRVEFNIVSDDLSVRKPLGKPIWDSIFRKPEPVVDTKEWYQSSQSDEFVYLPNNLRRVGPEAEEYMSNAMYTEVMVHAYRNLCKKVGINPCISLTNGVLTQAMRVMPADGSQQVPVGSRAARLANSKLVDFDDSAYAIEFIQSIIDLKPHLYDSEIVRRKVLAKVEHILMGKSSHVYNQRFIQRLLEKVQCTDMGSLLSVLTGLVSDGFVLEDSQDEFTSRVLRTPLASEANDIIKHFGDCRGK